MSHMQFFIFFLKNFFFLDVVITWNVKVIDMPVYLSIQILDHCLLFIQASLSFS